MKPKPLYNLKASFENNFQFQVRIVGFFIALIITGVFMKYKKIALVLLFGSVSLSAMYEIEILNKTYFFKLYKNNKLLFLFGHI